MSNSPALPNSHNEDRSPIGLWPIFFVSVLGLYLELLLIRWVSTEVRIFAYLQNTVLVVCILGLGMGCFACHRPIDLCRALRRLLLLTLLLAIPFSRNILGKISEMLSVLHDFVIWTPGVRGADLTSTGRVVLVIIGLALAFGLMLLLWDMFVPIGQLLGRLLDRHPRPLLAYSVNIAGSLVGVWLFVALSAWDLPPFVWLAVLVPLVLGCVAGSQRRQALWLLAGTVCLGFFASQEPDSREVRWSPYQKLVLRGREDSPDVRWDWFISVNSSAYQAMIDLSPQKVQRDPAHFSPQMRGYSQYDLPCRLHPHPEKVLIVGAGSGNDVAGALRNGASEVVAVEIDPVILSMGRRYHPEEPYQSAKVRTVVDDARAFFANSQERFDVIIFGLLDSHTTTAMTNARLDHFVYTREALIKAKTLLKEGGILFLSFEATKPFIADRMGSVLRDVFQETPLYFRIPSSAYGWGGAMFIAGNQSVALKTIAETPRLQTLFHEWQADAQLQPLTFTTKIAIDDWPYIYLDQPRLPLLHILLAGLIVALFFRARRQLKLSGAKTWSREHWHFFFLGAAFMLLEVQNISKAAVVLGNTWLVNAVIISGVLLMVLLSNGLAASFRKLPRSLVYLALCGCCLALYYVDLSWFAALPYLTRALVVGLLTTLPMLFSGLVFARSFAAAAEKDQSLGANLLGALVGALLQAVTYLIGIKALLLIVTAFYFCALLCDPRWSGVTKASGPLLGADCPQE